MSDRPKMSEEEILKRQAELDARGEELDRREAERAKQRDALRPLTEERRRQHEARRRELDEAETQLFSAVDVREAACAERERRLRERDTGDVERHRALEARAEELRAREERVALAEQERDTGFAERRRTLDTELRARRQELERQAEEEVSRLRLQRLSDLQGELAEERRRRREELSRELEAERADILARREAFEEERARGTAALAGAQKSVHQRQAELLTLQGDLDYRQKALTEREAQLDRRKQALDEEVEQRVAHRQRTLDVAEARLAERERAQDEEVEEAVAERRASFDAKERSYQSELTRLRGQIQSADRLLGAFESLKRQLGGKDAEVILSDLEAKESALRDLREQVLRMTPGMREEHERVCAERDRLSTVLEERTRELDGLRERTRGEDALRLDLQEEQGKSRSLAAQVESLEGRCNQLLDDNRRLRAAYEREQDREARVRDIEKFDPVFVPKMPRDEKVDEIDWLNGIEKACEDYGLRFHPRILRAFHTALKTAEWSPITVLAGVSGTGKSELPRLYAHFGGMTFRSLPVQPNWDSQEAMLGFFNSIDNKFDAQPVLRLLAQSQKADADSGMRDSMVMILLDEMNLAHAELYFAEFLSKLELRRGTKGNPPALEVKLGAGLTPYLIPMGRNVLWTGTMNQDETTKSLSDKVLDRSIVIHFPRPTRLERRRELKPLPAPAPLLHRKVWESWWVKKSELSEEQIGPFKAIIEEINHAMSRVGRALGHRVWQSVEYYMANYPDTLAARCSGHPEQLQRALRTAFEDQLVQKIMPKLRGIDTRGRSKTDCLDKVRALLENHGFGIVEDFNLSCECGHGQFIWQTVSFLQEPAPSAAESPAPDAQAGGKGA